MGLRQGQPGRLHGPGDGPPQGNPPQHAQEGLVPGHEAHAQGPRGRSDPAGDGADGGQEACERGGAELGGCLEE